jgi:Tol biopolymer transport system component
MGEVYRAHDTKLGRDVAIKILPADFADDPERVARFRREAQVLAALNHPHIAQLYGFEEGPAEGEHRVRALVMELVEGSTLADRLVRGPLPMNETLPMARQIAEALHAAHDKGITHRDLKPANIALTLEGNVKLLDFGLAKPAGPDAASPVAESPTITSPVMMTNVGTILGTAAYMSPEQAKGRGADKRSDVWAFGCVFYEMLTGSRAFASDNVQETLALVLTKEPDWLALPSEVPAVVRTLLEGCLAKDPRKRVADVSVAEFLLAERNAALLSGQASIGRSVTRRERLAWAAGLAAAVAVASALAGTHLFEPGVDVPSIRFSVAPPSDVSVLAGGGNSGAISPDGRRVVIPVAPRAGGPVRLAIRAFDTDSFQELPGTDGANSPFWAPDSRFIGFLAEGKLKRIDVAGGPPQVVCVASGLGGGTWNRESVIVFSGGSGPLFRVNADGGIPTQLTNLDRKRHETAHRYPWFLPDGRHFLYAATATSTDTTIYVGSLDQEMKVPVVQSDTRAIFAEGYLLFVRQDTLLAQLFDPSRLKTSGDPAVVAQDISNTRNTATASFSAADKGVLSYEATPHIPTQLVWVDRTGTVLKKVGQPFDQTGLELSPDGGRVALSIYDASRHTRDIWLHDFARGVRTRVSFTARDGWASSWSANGDRIAFSARRTGLLDLYLKATNGGGAEEELGKEVGNNRYVNSWSTDLKFLLYHTGRSRSETGNDIWSLPMSGDLAPRPFLQASANEQSGKFSPNGRWVAFTSDESGREEVYVVPFPGPGGRSLISTEGGTSPRWRQDGRELFYLTRGTLMAAAVNGQGSVFQSGTVARLFEANFRTESYQGYGPGSVYDVAPDGQRFLINVVATAEPAQAPITIVTQWTSLLRADP